MTATNLKKKLLICGDLSQKLIRHISVPHLTMPRSCSWIIPDPNRANWIHRSVITRVETSGEPDPGKNEASVRVRGKGATGSNPNAADNIFFRLYEKRGSGKRSKHYPGVKM